ncbi:glycosyltransferase [Neomegalonema sp.]|uniref:glycosyltransferase n=1 Tax=Neomegalonema sp. TaxID=2039713 RepID=UPI00261FECA7|nr:glycosyltransferase [Neomegalonema sp.]MDD2869680.1 hypothetical protein [Neomegalonema sp.]
MKKPVIAFVSQHHCIRALKQAIVLKDLGYEVHLVTNRLNNSHFYKSAYVYLNPLDFEEVVRTLKDRIDIWHIHNEPNWYVVTVRKVIPNAVIIMDYHDSHHWRLTEEQSYIYPEKEKLAFYMEDSAALVSDAFVTPSKKCRDEVVKRTGKKTIYVPSACPRKEFRIREFAIRGGLAIQGGMVSPQMVEKEGWNRWRDYTEFLQEIKGKIHVFAYSPSFGVEKPDVTKDHYVKLGVEPDKQFYHVLLDRLGEHSWNLVGNWQKSFTLVWDYALPNKFWDSVAAGVPSVSFNCPETSKIIKEYDIGLSLNHPKELINRWGEHIEKRKNLILTRDELCMENHIEKLTNLYEEII